MSQPRIPISTYRLQINYGFKFSDAARILGYLSDLGITDLYTSSYLKARQGSLHGYDIVDFNKLNDEIGSEEEYRAFVEGQKQRGMGQVFDMVPNHMCIASDQNLWWRDVLENGPSSLYARFFDINWHPVKRELTNRILVPVLGDQYGRVLENQELLLHYENGMFFISYWDYKFPIRPDTYIRILTYRKHELETLLTADNPHYIELLSITTGLVHLPSYTDTDPDKMEERNREKEIVKRRLHVLYGECVEVKAFVDENVRIFNGTKGEPGTFDLLDQLLQDQAYRLSYWRVATEEINYRRFFDINDLAAIRMEDPAVFAETHKLVLRLIREGYVTGLRVDHPDGLYNPSEYFHRLQMQCYVQQGLRDGGKGRAERMENEEGEAAAANQLAGEYNKLVFSGQNTKPCYIVGEKILMRNEPMPEEWPIYSTTGYTFCNLVNGLFIDPTHAKAFTRLYNRFTRTVHNYEQVVYEKKKFIMQRAMSSEINTLGHYLNRISEKNRHTRDFTLNSLTGAITEVIAFFPVYRTYINNWNIAERDAQHIEFAVDGARRANPTINESILQFVKDVLLLRCPPELNDEGRREWLDFVMRFQQITGPVMAKGLEDTAFYVYNRLVSLNEVGGSPDHFGTTVEEFHEHNLRRQQFWPHALITTSTHDSKRSEDVRARINVISELPEEWRKRVTRWSQVNKRKRVVANGSRIPDPNEEYLLYQTLLGAWPLGPLQDGEYKSFVETIKLYILKAIREAKVNTSWINPRTEYEDGFVMFVESVLKRGGDNAFLDDFDSFQRKIAYYGMFNSLSQTLLKIMSPGIPDFYQGTETWSFTLVDPDNRRPVDYEKRKAMLGDIRKAEKETAGRLAREVLTNWEDGRIKMYVTYKALNLRREQGGALSRASYEPVRAAGNATEHLCAFARRYLNRVFLVAVPRFLAKASDGDAKAAGDGTLWAGSFLHVPSLPPFTYENIFTDETVKTVEHQGVKALNVGEVFGGFPVALLVGREGTAEG